MVDKYLAVGGTGEQQETSFTQTSAGVGSAGKGVALNSSGQIDSTMLPETQVVSVVTSENLAAGAMVNIYSNAGTATARNADNTAVAKKAHGFTISAVTSPAAATVVLGDGVNNGVSGLTVGSEYYLGTTGAVVVGASIPTATGSFVQRIGVARTATELEVNINETVMIRA